jgi:hypothetical protein
VIKDLVDFRGGYCTDVPSHLMSDNELLVAENCYWRDGIVKRRGISTYSETDISSFTIRGSFRAYLNSTWYTILALDDGSVTNLYYGTAGTFTAIDNDKDFTKGVRCEFDQLLDAVVMVNGSDKPAVIYYSSGVVVEDLETYDERVRENDNWVAGAYDTSEANPFVDDTTDAQDVGADDFQVVTDTNDDGFYVACDFTFNKVIIKNCQQAGGAPVAAYSYWNGTAWTSITPGTTPTWTAAEGDKTIEFDIPLDSDGACLMQPYVEDGAPEEIAGRYMMRVIFSTAPSAILYADYLVVSHTQYLTQILADAKPHAVCVHNNQMFLAERNVVNMSPVNTVKGWGEGFVESFVSGGSRIIAMRSFGEALVVVKENTVYTLDTNNYLDPVRSRPLTTVGAASPDSVVNAGQLLFFASTYGFFAWTGSSAVNISKHIQTEFDTYTPSGISACFYEGLVYFCNPATSEADVFDPDTFRMTDMGDGRVSFYHWTGYRADQFIPCIGYGDTGYLLGTDNSTTNKIVRCEYGAYDNLGAATAIDMKIQTKYFSSESLGMQQRWGIVKPLVGEVSAATGSNYTITFYSDYADQNVAATVVATVGSGIYSSWIRLPYYTDGKNLSFHLRHNSVTSAKLYGYSFEFEGRVF